jgi:hypothetical protein
MRSAVSWSGTDVVLAMFVVSPRLAAPAPHHPLTHPPDRVRVYELEDVRGVLGEHRHLYEYDFVWREFPPGVDDLVSDYLVSALEDGAVIALFGFEGSFDFEYLLHPDVASQIYAVASNEGLHLAIDDEHRLSDEWRDVLRHRRESVLR